MTILDLILFAIISGVVGAALYRGLELLICLKRTKRFPGHPWWRRIELKWYRYKLPEDGIFVLQDRRSGHYLAACHTTGSMFRTPYIQQADTYGKASLLNDLDQFKSTPTWRPIQVVSYLDRTPIKE